MLYSPAFNATSAWQKDVHVFWTYLTNQYKIYDNPKCDVVTRVDRRSAYAVEDTKRFAQAIIYFYPALYTFQPSRMVEDAVEWYRADDVGWRPWKDDPDPATTQRSRSQVMDSINAIEAFDPAVAMHWAPRIFLRQANAVYCDWLFYWLIVNKELSWRSYNRTISSIDDAVWWAEFRVSFMQACLALTSLARLQRIPRTLEGLREFMSGKSPPLGTTLRGRYRPRGAREV